MKKSFVKTSAGLIAAALTAGIIFCFPVLDVNRGGRTVSLMSCDRVFHPPMTQNEERLPKNRNPVVAPSDLVFLGAADNVKVDFLSDQSSAGHKISPQSDLYNNSPLRNVPHGGVSLSLRNQILRI